MLFVSVCFFLKKKKKKKIGSIMQKLSASGGEESVSGEFLVLGGLLASKVFWIRWAIFCLLYLFVCSFRLCSIL